MTESRFDRATVIWDQQGSTSVSSLSETCTMQSDTSFIQSLNNQTLSLASQDLHGLHSRHVKKATRYHQQTANRSHIPELFLFQHSMVIGFTPKYILLWGKPAHSPSNPTPLATKARSAPAHGGGSPTFPCVVQVYGDLQRSSVIQRPSMVFHGRRPYQGYR